MPFSATFQKIQGDILAAMKAKDAERLRVLRFLKSMLDSAAKDKLADLTEEEAIKVISRKIKQSNEAKEKYIAASRDDMVKHEQFEIDLVSSYLPPQMALSELDNLVTKVMDGLGAVTKKDFGKIMGAVVKQTAGRADGGAVKAAIERALDARAP